MTGALLLMTILAPLVLAPVAAGRHGRWMPALAALPALAAAAVVPTGTTLEFAWLLMGSHLGVDAIGRWFLASGALVWLAAALFAAASVRDEGAGRFRLFFTLAMAGSLGLTLAQDMVAFYVGFALMGLSGYGLVAHHGSTRTRRAGRLYLAWTIVGEVAVFAGLVFLVAATGTHVMADVAAAPPTAAAALLVLGFGIKLALPGLHVWLPTAYANAPAAGAAALSGPMIAAGLLVPSLVTFLWMSTFGGTALHLERFTEIDIAQQALDDVAISLHLLLSELPLGAITPVFATLVIIIFFITSSDSGSLVDDMVTSGGHPHPPVSQRVFWAVSEGAVASTLLIVGGLTAIQQAAITMALPMTLLLIAACYGMVRAFATDIGKSGPPARGRIEGDIGGD